MRLQTGDTEQILFLVLKKNSDPATGRTTIRVRIYRKSDNWFFDFNDLTFKPSGWTTLDATMVEIDATNAAGHYELPGGFNTGIIINSVPNDTYVTFASQTSGNDILPGPGEITVGFWADDIAKIDDVATTAPGSAITGSLLDRLANKDGNKSYDQDKDSLENISKQLGRADFP